MKPDWVFKHIKYVGTDKDDIISTIADNLVLVIEKKTSVEHYFCLNGDFHRKIHKF